MFSFLSSVEVFPPIQRAKPVPEDVSAGILSLYAPCRRRAGKSEIGQVSKHHTSDVLLEACKSPEKATNVISKGKVINCMFECMYE